MAGATALAKSKGARLQVVVAVPFLNYGTPYAATIATQFPDFQDDLKKQARKQLEKLMQLYSIQPDDVLVENGFPENVIDDCCQRDGNSILVIGTVANKGLAGVFMGNTAERMLHQVNVDTLVVS